MAVVCTLGIYVASNDDDASGSALFWFSIFIRMKAVPGNSFSNVYQAEFYLERVIYAAGRGHLRFIQAFVQAGGDINQKHHNESILQAASGSGHVDLVRFLLSHDADIVNGSERPEALTAAANAEHIEVVQAFVEHHRSITPANFFAALRKQNSAILKVFLSAGSTPNMVDEQQNSALEVASRDLQDLALIQLLLEYRVDLTRGGVEALRVASHHGNLDVVELLLEKGVDPNQDTFSQISPLQAASEQGHLKVVETLRGKLSLLKFKVFTSTPATFHSEGGGFGSPLHAACARGHWDVVQNLTTQHYDSQGRPQQLTQYVGHGLLDTQGQIPLAAAILHRPANPNRLHIIRFFLNHLKSSGSPWEGHLDLSDPIHGTILHVAASVGDTGAAEYLLPHIDVNLRAGPYDTALQTACEHNHLTFVRFLLDHGANPNTDIENHPRSLFCAAQNHNLEMVEALLSRDADASARSDISGKSEGTAIDVSKNLGFADVVDLLTRSRI
ncbi:ankyrin repeat-containing domain protein [Flagelloscypha sp. PMI_526]|nr:ankyrin repeat-containing domain protein [Flagelloscypha sp. PMI_526]